MSLRHLKSLVIGPFVRVREPSGNSNPGHKRSTYCRRAKCFGQRAAGFRIISCLLFTALRSLCVLNCTCMGHPIGASQLLICRLTCSSAVSPDKPATIITLLRERHESRHNCEFPNPDGPRFSACNKCRPFN